LWFANGKKQHLTFDISSYIQLPWIPAGTSGEAGCQHEKVLQDACQRAITLMEGADINMWSSFLPSVMRAVLGEGGQALLVRNVYWEAKGKNTGKRLGK
jgi:hypothetical protein